MFVANAKTVEHYRHRFPKSLDGAPMFLPADNTALRKNLDFWFESQSIRPMVLGEFEDYALLRAFGETGAGVFPMPSIFGRLLPFVLVFHADSSQPQRTEGRIHKLQTCLQTQQRAHFATRAKTGPAIAISNT
jgi:hypothetical protein